MNVTLTPNTQWVAAWAWDLKSVIDDAMADGWNAQQAIQHAFF